MDTAIEKKDTPEKVSEQILAQPAKDFNIDLFIAKRKEFIEKVNEIMVNGSDFHVIQGRKSMAKGGAEKVANIFGWQARFTKDTDVMEALKVAGMIAFVCDLEKNGQFVGQGRGAALLSKNAGDPNKCVKMAQKASFVDAVIRASGLSDFYSQDLEDMRESEITPPHGANSVVQGQQPHKAPIASPGGSGEFRQPFGKPSEKQLDLIRKLVFDKLITQEEIHAEGFSGYPDNLTGGKGGTASELIDWLLKYRTSGGNAQRNWGGHKHLPDELPVIQQDPEREAFDREMANIGKSVN